MPYLQGHGCHPHSPWHAALGRCHLPWLPWSTVRARMNHAKEILPKYARAWGIPIHWSKHPNYWTLRSVAVGPDRGDLLSWDTPRPIMRWRGSVTPHNWPYFLHELGHAISGQNPNSVDELEWQTGFELLSIKALGLPMRTWRVWQGSYRLTDPEGPVVGGPPLEWKTMPLFWRRRRMEMSQAKCIELGFFDAFGWPTFKRRVYVKPYQSAA